MDEMLASQLGWFFNYAGLSLFGDGEGLYPLSVRCACPGDVELSVTAVPSSRQFKLSISLGHS